MFHQQGQTKHRKEYRVYKEQYRLGKKVYRCFLSFFVPQSNSLPRRFFDCLPRSAREEVMYDVIGRQAPMNHRARRFHDVSME